jgi:hypothetical protein
MPENRPQRESKHPDEWERDLNPDRMAGQNIGPDASEPERGTRTAYDVKPVHRALSDWPDDELKRIPVLEEGTRLRQGATYLNLRERDRGEVTATGEMQAAPGDAWVPKDEVPYPTWNRLRGVDDPERL